MLVLKACAITAPLVLIISKGRFYFLKMATIVLLFCISHTPCAGTISPSSDRVDFLFLLGHINQYRIVDITLFDDGC